jgi:tRNA (guanine37-N1)-methyltransferase
MITFDILTIFPEQITQFLDFGVTRIAQENKLLKYTARDLRKYTTDRHKTVDDRPYGGGAGMVMKVEPVYKALKDIKQKNSKVILMTPTGQTFDQKMAKELAQIDQDKKNAHYIVLCGHYEGFDHRIHQHLADMEVSVGNYVLSGGELGALIIIDAVTRLVPGVLGNESSLDEESFENDSLEYPHFTRPEVFNDWKVPDVLLSGNHQDIAEWRSTNSKKIE